MKYQPVHRTGTRSQAQARRLVAASQQPAPHVLAATIYDEDVNQPVAFEQALEPMKIGNVILATGDCYYLVASEKFTDRYYVVFFNDAKQAWQFSGEAELAKKYIGKVKAYDAAASAA
jgi:hypothetical protein